MACAENKGVILAPQVGLEPTTLRLTGERLLAASRCKHDYLRTRNEIFGGIWGGTGGSQSFLFLRTRSIVREMFRSSVARSSASLGSSSVDGTPTIRA